MPDNIFLTTEIGDSTTALVIDQTGDFVSTLVDSLLSRGFNVYYFGVITQEGFDYLSHKKSFNYLHSFQEQNIPEKIDYLYYFPKNNLDEIKNIAEINKRDFCRILIGVDYNFSLNNELENLSDSKDFIFRLIFYKDVYGPRVTKTELGKLFFSLVKEKRITIEKNSQDLIAPLSSGSLIRELLKISFLPLGKGKTFLLKPEELTLEELGGQLINYFPEREFVFTKDNIFREKEYLPKGGKTIIIKESLDLKLEETAEWFERGNVSLPVEEKSISVTEEPKPLNPRFSTEIVEEVTNISDEVLLAEKETLPTSETTSENEKNEIPKNSIEGYWEEKKQNKKGTKRGLFFLLLFIFLTFCFFALPLVVVLFSGIKGLEGLKQTKNSLEAGEYSLSLKYNQKANKYLGISQKTLSLANPFYSLIGLGEQTKSIAGSISFSSQIGQSLQAFLQTFDKITLVGGNFLKGESVDWLEMQRLIKTNYAYAYQQASLAQSSLKEAEEGFNYFKKAEVYEMLSEYLQSYRDKLLKGQSFSLILPDIIGIDSRKTYLVLFQNNLELRPTGGFISAIGLLTLENGKLIDFEIHDIYKADNLLKGQVEPPSKISEILGEKTWYFRDSNFDPEFSVSAQKALWFLDKEMNVTADGVIAVNLKMLKSILAVLGEVSLEDYTEKITAENLYPKVIQYSETANLKNEERKEFLVSLVEAIFKEVKKIETKKIAALEGVFFNQLENKEALLFFLDSKIQSGLVDLGWDGGLRQYQRKVEGYSILSDYLALNEANFGINKVNYFMDRKVDHQIEISKEGLIKEKLSLVYENKSPSENWPAGSYKNYLRIYLPKGIKLVSALKTDPLNSDIWAPFPGQNLEILEQSEKTVLGLLFEVPVKAKIKLEINYELNETLDLSAKINSYLLMVQKQPGIYSEDYNLIVSFPSNLVPLRVIPKAVVGEGKLLINEKLSKDRIFQVDLAI